MDKVIVFDFDKTLTEIDTLFGFFVLASRGMCLRYPLLLLYVLSMVLTKLKIITNSTLKSLGIRFFLNGMKREDVETIGEQYAKTIAYSSMLDEALSVEGEVYIATASFDVYAKYALPGATIVASTIAYEDDVVVGLEFNCYGKNKIDGMHDHEIDLIDILYTDSISDLPLVNMSKKIYLVKKSNKILFNSPQQFIDGIRNGSFDF